MENYLYDQITGAEKEALVNYIKEYNGTNTISKPLSYILRFWASAKTDLYDLLGHQLTVSKTVTYEESFEYLERMFDSSRPTNQVLCKFRTFMDNIAFTDTPSVLKPYIHELISYLGVGVNCLIENKYKGKSFKIEFPNDTTLSIQNGMKAIKVMDKINKIYHYCTEKEFEEFRIYHSQILNQKKLTGKLVLSIHPLDYLTMSDNKCGWSSCMSWKKQGCYRMGTVEMMNSPMVVVAYLDSKEPMMIGDLPWSNKKWRQLFVVNDKCIASVKGYPYKNSNLTKTALELLVNLAEENLGIKYTNQKTDEEVVITEENFYTTFMYNDFNYTDDCYIYENTEIKSLSYPVINYSGMAECMCCGEKIGWFDYSNEEADFLSCKKCLKENTCHYCGEPLNDKYYILDNCKYCRECYYELAIKEFGTNKVHYWGRLNPLVVQFPHQIKIIYSRDNRLNFNKKYLKEGRKIQYIRDEHQYSINFDDLKPEWQEYFNHYNPHDVWDA